MEKSNSSALCRTNKGEKKEEGVIQKAHQNVPITLALYTVLNAS